MSLPAKPHRAIFPVVALGPGGSFRRLGTGFFIHLNGLFMTARHVLDVPLVEEEKIAVLMNDGEKFDLLETKFSSLQDIAVARIDPPTEIIALALSSSDPPGNDNALTYEFSDVVGASVTPSTRKGHIVSYIPWRSQKFSTGDARFLKLSFMAPIGASGAPIMTEKSGDVVGMIVDSSDQSGIDYRMPIGLAIDWRHLREFCAAEGLELEIFMTANVPRILTFVRDRLNAALLEAASKRGGIIDRVTIESLRPSRVEAMTVDQANEGSSRQLRFSIDVRAEVSGWGGPTPMGEGSWFGGMIFTARVEGEATAPEFEGRLYGDAGVTRVEVSVPSHQAVRKRLVIIDSVPPSALARWARAAAWAWTRACWAAFRRWAQRR